MSFEDKKNLVHTIEDYAIHPDYNENTFANDVAVLKFPKLERFNRRQQKICLPVEQHWPDFIKVPNRFFAIGWGGTTHKVPGDHPTLAEMSDKLKQVELPFIKNEECAANVRNKTLAGEEDWYFNSTTQFCGADKTGKNDTCGGDSGGPTMVLTKDKSGRLIWLQVGLVSWGYGCAHKGELGYYTKVKPFLDWIEKAKQDMTHKSNN